MHIEITGYRWSRILSALIIANTLVKARKFREDKIETNASNVSDKKFNSGTYEVIALDDLSLGSTFKFIQKSQICERLGNGL